jgi:hypothetical protein
MAFEKTVFTHLDDRSDASLADLIEAAVVRSCKNASFFEFFPYVCPEPVLAK